jgi:hypothetical protein
MKAFNIDLNIFGRQNFHENHIKNTFFEGEKIKPKKLFFEREIFHENCTLLKTFAFF